MVALVLGAFSAAAADNLFSRPLVVVLPKTLNFGAIPTSGSATNFILLENPGSGTLVGKATVEPPFKIVAGADYSLKRAGAQLITIVYTPSDATLDKRIVKFTGGNGGSVTVLGHAAPPPSPTSRLKHR